MMKTIILKNQRSDKRNQRSVLIFFALCGFALSPLAQAAPQVVPPPDGCYPGFTTAEGCNALKFLTTGAGNTGVGWYSLFLVGAANYNTGLGAGALALTTTGADSNTAVGTAALLLNTSGSQNVAVGTDALVYNDSGADNNAVGAFALFNNVTGAFNVAIGDSALNNADSVFNTAVGFDAGQATTTGFDNIYLGDTAGTLDLDGIAVPDETQTTRIGSVFTEGGLAGAGECYIGGIRNQGQVWNGVTVCQVTVRIDGRLGVDCLNPDRPGGFNQYAPQAPVPHSAPQPRGAPQQPAARPQFQAMNRKVEALEATVAELRAQLKEQAAQIQKVSAQLEMGQPATKVVSNKP